MIYSSDLEKVREMKQHELIGLTEEEVNASREVHGSNMITTKKQDSFFKLLVESLGDPIIKILLVALGIKVVFLLKDFD